MSLRLVSDRDKQLDEMSPEQREYEVSVETALGEVANYLMIGEGCSGVINMIAHKGEGFAVEKFNLLLHERAVAVSPTLRFRGSKKFADDVCVRLATLGQGTCVMVAPMKDFGDAEVSNGYVYRFEGPYFIFRAVDFASEDQYRGRQYTDVMKTVEKKFGKESQELRDVNRVIELVRSWLYGDEEGWHRDAIAMELVELRVKVGVAAIAVITDFLRNFDERVEGVSDDDVVDECDRFFIGGIDLRDLASRL